MASAPKSAVPPFSMTEPRYDQKTFQGRLKTMMNIVNPAMLFVSDARLQAAEQLLQEFKVRSPSLLLRCSCALKVTAAAAGGCGGRGRR